MPLQQSCSKRFLDPFMRALAEGEKWLREAPAEMQLSSTGQIKMHGANARWFTILPMLQTRAGL
jgi:hypothetical protein